MSSSPLPLLTAVLLVGVLVTPAAAQDFRPGGLPGVFDTTNFRVHYDPDPGSPDHAPDAYVEQVGGLFEEALAAEVGTQGWERPVDDGTLGGDSRMDVYLADQGANNDAFTSADRTCSLPSCSSVSAYVVLDVGQSAQGLRALAIHEFHHMIQYAESADTDTWWREATSTWEESVVAPDTTSRLSQISSFARTTSQSLTDLDSSREYGAYVFLRWLADRHGIEVLQDAWRRTRVTGGQTLPALDQVLVERGSSFVEEFGGFAAASTIWNRPGAFPREIVSGSAVTYPEITRLGSLSLTDTVQVAVEGASYDSYDVAPTDDVTVDVSVDGPLAGSVALTAVRLDGTTATSSAPLGDGDATISLDGLGDVRAITLTLVNAETANSAKSATFQATLTSQSGPQPTDRTVSPGRVDGQNRYDTAASLATLDHPDGADRVILARADDFPDALAAAPLTFGGVSPVLVTDSRQLNPETAQAITDLGASTVVVMGGSAAVSQAVIDALPQSVTTVQRVAGPNRFATAAEAARTLAGDGLGTFEGAVPAFVGRGGDFAGALAAGPAAAAQRFPVLLAEDNRLPTETASALEDLGITRVYLLGGPPEISADVEDRIAQLGIDVVRLAGEDRLDTVATIAEQSVRAGWVEGDSVLLGRGDLFVDVLAAGPHGAVSGSPILLSESPDRLGGAAVSYLADPSLPFLDAVQAIGGQVAVSRDVLGAAVRVANTRGPVQEDTAGAPFFAIVPAEEVAASPGQPVVYAVEPRFSEQLLPEVLDLALLPCAAVDISDNVSATFTDADGDGRADGLGATETGQTVFTRVNGTDVPDTTVLYDVGVIDNRLNVEVVGAAPDCAAVLVWDDEDGDGQLRLDQEGDPAAVYGIGQVRITD